METKGFERYKKIFQSTFKELDIETLPLDDSKKESKDSIYDEKLKISSITKYNIWKLIKAFSREKASST